MKIKNIIISISILITLIYLVVLPKGYIGVFMMVIALILALTNVNNKTVGIYLLYFGLAVMGIIFQMIKINNTGSIIAFLLGIILLTINKIKINKYNPQWEILLPMMIPLIITLTIFYYYGPQTEYCKHKIISIIINLSISIFTFYYIINDYAVDMWKLGLLGVISSILYYSIIVLLVPSILPQNIFITAGMRNIVSMNNMYEKVPLQTIANICSSGIILIISSLTSNKISKNNIYISIIVTFIGFILLNSVGERLFIIIPILAIAPILFTSKNNRKYFRIIFIILTVLLSVIIIYAIQSNNDVINSIIASDNSFVQKINRGTNWYSASDIINEHPFLGVGLGGYYIKGYSKSGSGTYAHNLILELLSETGFIGTIIILFPFVLFIIKKRKIIIALNTANGCTVLPLLIMYFLLSMISYDLTKSVDLFAIIIIIKILINRKVIKKAIQYNIPNAYYMKMH